MVVQFQGLKLLAEMGGERLVREGSKKVMPPIFFLSETVHYSYNGIEMYHRYVPHRVEMIYPQGPLR